MPFLLILEWANLTQGMLEGEMLGGGCRAQGVRCLINFQKHLHSFLVPRNKSRHVFLSFSPRNVGSYWNAQEEPHLDCRGFQPTSEFLTKALQPLHWEVLLGGQQGSAFGVLGKQNSLSQGSILPRGLGG